MFHFFADLGKINRDDIFLIEHSIHECDIVVLVMPFTLLNQSLNPGHRGTLL